MITNCVGGIKTTANDCNYITTQTYESKHICNKFKTKRNS